MADQAIAVRCRWDVWAYLGILLKAVHQGQPSLSQLLSQAAAATLHLNEPDTKESARQITQKTS